MAERIWQRLPARVRQSRPLTAYGSWSHSMICRRADREMYLGTFFLRNRPSLELLRQLAQNTPSGATLSIAVLGCSIGVEVYSILWILRPARPDVKMVVRAVDNSAEVLTIAEAGTYGPENSDMVASSIFERLTPVEREEMFDWDGERACIKPWLREGITWQVSDACDPELGMSLGSHDVVIANNFLCHMDATSAERCLRNLAQIVKPGGYLFVAGVDLDVRTKVALDLAWTPVGRLTTEIHDGDPSVRADWPWKWWGLEPLDRRRPDWQTRYSVAFRVGSSGKEQGRGSEAPWADVQ